MSETVQEIIVYIIVGAATAWSIQRIFFAPKKRCGPTKSGECGDCQLLDACRKKEMRKS